MTEKDKEMVVTPWEVSGDIDYDKLIEQFGVQPMTVDLAERIAKHAGGMHLQLRRGVYMSHRAQRTRPPWPPASLVLLQVPAGRLRR